MDKERFTRILTKELGDKLGREIVIEDFYKDSLIKNASVICQISSPFLLDLSNFGEIINEGMLGYKGAFVEANYYFLKNVQLENEGYSVNKLSRFVVTPYALIGEKEKYNLKRLFYKDVNPEIAYAMDTLGIDNFIDFYKTYSNKSHDNFLIQILKEEDSIMKEDLEMAKKFIDLVSKLKYDNDVEVNKGVLRKNLEDFKSLNVRFERIGTKTHIDSHDATGSGYVTRATLLKLVGELSCIINNIESEHKDTLWNEFIDFVFFSLPYEEQNIESNKTILKNSLNLDFITAVLSKEYSDGKYFREYFDVLGKEAQDKFVESLKIFSDKKPIHDSFLWSKGFKDIKLDYMDIYKKDANTFIEYFSKRTPGEKKVIIKEVMNCDFINDEIVNWLNEHEPELLREVGFN